MQFSAQLKNQELSEDVFRDLTELENYAEETYSSLMYLGLECLGVKNIKADHVASHIGKAQGLSILLRATPYHSSKRRCYLPLDLVTKVPIHTVNPIFQVWSCAGGAISWNSIEIIK